MWFHAWLLSGLRYHAESEAESSNLRSPDPRVPRNRPDKGECASLRRERQPVRGGAPGPASCEDTHSTATSQAADSPPPHPAPDCSELERPPVASGLRLVSNRVGAEPNI